jgi:hypothetical protein
MRRGVAIVAVAFTASASDAAELRSSVDASARYNTNAPSSREGEESSDVHLDGRLRLDLLSDPGRRLNWRLGYAPGYERFLDLQELDNWRHRATGAVSYALTQRTSLAAQADFSRSTRTNVEGDPDAAFPDPQPALEETDEEIDTGSLDLSLSHTFGPRWAGSTSASYAFTDYSREDRSDFEAATASTNLSYAMTARQSVGGGVSFSRQVVKEADLETAIGDVSTRAEQVTRFASLFGNWNYELSPLWRLDLQAGPTFIDSDIAGDDAPPLPVTRVPSVGGIPLDADVCTVVRFGVDELAVNDLCVLLPTPLPPGFVSPTTTLRSDDLLDQGTSTTLFANFGVARSGERTRFSLRYSRSAGENFGGRTSTISDVLTSSWSWRPDLDWSFDLGASYSKRQQATSASVFQGFPLLANNGSVPGIPDDVAIVGVRPDGSARVLTSEVDDAFDVESWVVSLRASRRITRRFSGFVKVRYLDQVNNGAEGSVVQDLDGFEFGLGIDYAFDPIRL